MKKNILFGALFLMAGSLLAADSSPKDDASAAAKKLTGTSYSWKMTMDMGANAQFTPGPTEGKIDKDGLTQVSSTFQDNTSVGYVKGTKVVVKTDSGWKSSDELDAGGGGGGGGFDPSTFMVRRLQGVKAPAAELQEILAKAGELKKDGDVISGELTKEGAESMLTSGFGFGGRRGGGGPGGAQRPPPKDAKATLKIWLKDGNIAKYETKVTGKMDFQGEERDIERTSTTEVKDVGTTKIEVPDEAKKKLG
jgi:hypothetical protein